MAAVPVTSTTPTIICQGFEGTAQNPDQFSVRFAPDEEGRVYVERTEEKTTSAEGWFIDAGEQFSVTMTAGQVLYAVSETGTVELRVLPLTI